MMAIYHEKGDEEEEQEEKAEKSSPESEYLHNVSIPLW